MSEPLEIERKWLIEYPSVDMMKNMTDYDYSEIEQTYTNYMEHSAYGRIRKEVRMVIINSTKLLRRKLPT